MKEFATIDWVEMFSRLHPVALHLPIGLFVALAWMHLLGLLRPKSTSSDVGRGPLVFLLVGSALLSSASGWTLHDGGNYPEPIDLHKWGGVAVCVVAMLVGVAHWRRSASYGRLLWLGVLLMIPTAHLGGTLTHGEGFLLDPLLKETVTPVKLQAVSKGEVAKSVAAIDPAIAPGLAPSQPSDSSGSAFQEVQPIFEELCFRCHGERKQRGGLALYSLAVIALGGDSGAVLVPGAPSESLLLSHLLSPLDADEHMPPPKKPQPTAAQISAIESWIQRLDSPPLGNDVEPVATDLAVQDLAVAGSNESVSANEPPFSNEDQPLLVPVMTEASVAAVALLRERLAHVQPISDGALELWIDFTATVLEPGELTSLLTPLREHVVELILANKELDQSDFSLLAQLPRLVSLDLRRLPLESVDIARLSTSTTIRTLNLAGTSVGAGTEQQIAEMVALERVFLWGTGIEGSLDSLRERRPELSIVGIVAPREALEVEPEVVFDRLPDPVAVAADSETLNTMCPITGEPVDSRYVILYEGRAIGFCCPNCPKAFWADPVAGLAKLDSQ